MKHKTVLYLFFFVATVIIISSCQNRPKEVLNRKAMERLMYDVYIAEAIMENDYQNFDTPEKKEAYIREVFKKHRITQAEWDTSLSWYSDRIDTYLKMNDSVKARLQRTQREIDAQIGAQYAQNQQYNQQIFSISYIPTMFSFADDSRSGFRFRLDSAEISSRVPEADFNFSLNVVGVNQAQKPNLQSVLMLEYEDTTIYRFSQITENREYKIPVSKYILNDTLKSIDGFVKLQDPYRANREIQLFNIFLGNKKDTTQQDIAPAVRPDREQLLRADTITSQ